MRELLSVKGLGRAAGPRVDDLQTYLRSDRSARIIIRLRLLWGSDHGHNNWKMVRLHFEDAEAPESLEAMLSVFKTPCEANREDIDSILVTVTVWNMESKSDLLPTPWCVVDIIEYSHLQLFTWQAVPIDGTTIADALVS
ncbi:hypothetical protein JG687_00014857 [Phytophthora cactorum]|uniref:Uncharacterized protein n=1 Tax=Phytophthora cactorum TaxID=29920 RepID=A0A8T1TVY0_9STRA|nr:hypothetical protein JG687_00014857 [Phytophthora cactorum]